MLPTFRCVDEDKKLVNAFTPVGTYPITGSYTTNSNPNYNISVIDGNLEVKQDSSLPTWFQLVGEDSEVSLDSTLWHNEDINIVLHPSLAEAGTYDEISLDKTLWSSTQVQVSEEGEHQKDVYFRIQASNLTHPLALASPQATTIKIDKTEPVIKFMSGTLINKDEISQLLNNLTLGNFFKPGTKVSIQGEDPIPNVDTKVSGLANINYEVYEIDSTGHIGSIPSIAKTSLTPDEEGIVEFTFNSIGKFRICAIATDTAGNIGPEKCSDINVKKIDVDVDNDDDPEFVDPDGDGCPDINIPIGKDSEGNWIKLNVDRNKDNIPDLNIDSDGDGIGEINVDTDHDGKPDLNLINLTKWNPTYCVEGQAEEYCTMPDIKAEINIDLKKDLIPDINIDNVGDFKPHLNITKPGETKPYLNIVAIHKWKPEVNYKNGTFNYDSIAKDQPKPTLNIDSNDDGNPDLNIDLDKDGEPDLNIDLDLNGIPDINIDSTGDKKADVNVDTDGDGNPDENIITLTKWEPDTVIKGDITYDTMSNIGVGSDTIIDSDTKVEIKKEDGTKFLPNYALKVKDISKEADQDLLKHLNKDVKENQEVKSILDIQLTDGTTTIQPDGKVKVRIPADPSMKNVTLRIELADGSFKDIKVEEKDGYYVYETDYLGKVGIIADKEQRVDEPLQEDPIANNAVKPPSVQGNYSGGIGGAGTGDDTNISFYGILFILSMVSSWRLCRRKK